MHNKRNEKVVPFNYDCHDVLCIDVITSYFWVGDHGVTLKTAARWMGEWALPAFTTHPSHTRTHRLPAMPSFCSMVQSCCGWWVANDSQGHHEAHFGSTCYIYIKKTSCLIYNGHHLKSFQHSFKNLKGLKRLKFL